MMNLDKIFNLDLFRDAQKFNHVFSLEIMGVLLGFKKIAKLEPYKLSDLERNKHILDDLNLSYVYFEKNEYFDDKKMLFLKGNSHDVYIDLYVSKIRKTLGILEELHKIHSGTKYENYVIGKLLGYPECCINNFLEGDYNGDLEFNIRIKERTVGKFDWRLNNLINPFSLIPFFPCSYNCEKAIEYAENNLKITKKRDQIKDVFNNVILYKGFWDFEIIKDIKGKQKNIFNFKS